MPSWSPTQRSTSCTSPRPTTTIALEAGKAVVVEKPMGLNTAEARDLADLATVRGLFLMEALWTLCLPKFDVIRQLVEDRGLGDIRSVIADMGEHFGPEHRIMCADLAGGPMLDLGTYPVVLATWLLGAPTVVVATGSPAPNGINGQVAAALRFPTGAVASVHTTILGNTPTTATVVGTTATLHLDGPFYRPGGFTVRGVDGRTLRYDEPAVDHAALYFEAAEAARRIAGGDLASPLRPPADTIVTLEAMDAIRREVGITFTEEQAGVGAEQI